MAGTLILATHGIDGGPGAAADHARAIRGRDGWSEVTVGCLRAEPSLAAALSGAVPPVTVVPLLMAEGYIYRIIRRRLEELSPRGRWRLAAPVGSSTGLAGLILRRAEAMRRQRGWAMSRTSLLLIGHGTPRLAASAEHACTLARSLATCGYAEVGFALLEEPPLPAAAAQALRGDNVVAVGLFLDNGPHGDADVRAALTPVEKWVAYTGAIGTDPSFASLIVRQARQTS
jgi:sirohydrochlorin ferrochelatase